MNRTENVRVKICCMGSVEEAKLAVAYGASAVGLVSEMPSGPGPISEKLIEEIAATVPTGVATVLLTCKHDAEGIIAQQLRTKVNTIQIVDEFPIAQYATLRRKLPGVKFVQVIHVRGEESIDEARKVAAYVDALLLDSGNPTLKTKELGGTGRVHDWSVSKRIRESIEIPVYLAGGLKAENVAESIRVVGPFAVDVCSGVRTNDKLDEEKLAQFFARIQQS